MFHAMLPPPPPLFNEAQSQHSQSASEIEATQVTGSQPFQNPFANLWGRLIPAANPRIEIVDLAFDKDEYIFGRAPGYDIYLAGQRISQKHCIVRLNSGGDVVVEDWSTNGTYINGMKIGKKRAGFLKAGDELSLGAPGVTDVAGSEDYRYIFRAATDVIPPGCGLNDIYDISDTLGRGAFATVRKALHRDEKKIYAIKIIAKSRFNKRDTNGNNDGGAAAALMFKRERSIMRSLKHPNVVEFKEDFEDEATIYMVMDFLPGGDLLDFIQLHGGLPEDEGRHVTRQICAGIAYCHSKGITHRDLKPENVLLDFSDATKRYPIVKVADFGLAKHVDSQTFLKTMCGTPAYLAPEVILGGGGYDQVVDSWAVGAMTFSMLTNSVPFDDDPDMDWRTRMQSRVVNWQVMTDAGLSDQSVDFCSRLMLLDPKIRMTMIEALSHPWFEGLPKGPEFDPSTPPLDHRGDIQEMSSSSFAISATDPVTPQTPAQKLRELESCSQDFGNMKIDQEALRNGMDVSVSEGVGLGLVLGSKFSADSDMMMSMVSADHNNPPSQTAASDSDHQGMDMSRIVDSQHVWRQQRGQEASWDIVDSPVKRAADAQAAAEGDNMAMVSPTLKRKASSSSSSSLSPPPPENPPVTPIATRGGKKRFLLGGGGSGTRSSARLRGKDGMAGSSGSSGSLRGRARGGGKHSAVPEGRNVKNRRLS